MNRRFELNLSDCGKCQQNQSENIRRRAGGERDVEEASLLTEGDLNNQYDKSAFPSYSRIDFADML